MSRPSVTKNLVSSLGAHVFRYLLPLISYPYLSRVLGVHSFGVFAFCQAAVQVIAQLTEFGFSNMGGRELATAHDKPDQARATVGVIMAARLVTLAIAVTGAAILLPFIPNSPFRDPSLLAATIFTGVCYGMSPAWFYLGQERAGRLASLEFAAQALQLALTFILVRGRQDVVEALLVSSIPVGLISLWGHYQAVRTIGWSRPVRRDVQKALTESLSFFVLVGAPSIINRACVLVLGALAPAAQVAYFMAGERLTSVAIATIRPVTRVLMPRMTVLVGEDKVRARQFFRRAVFLGAPLLGLGGVVGAVISPWFTPLFFGPEMRPGWPIVSAMLLILVPVGFSRMIAFCGLIPNRQEHNLQKIVLGAGVASLVIAAPAILLFDAMGLAITRIVTEILVAGLSFLLIWRLQPDWLQFRRPTGKA